MTYTFSDLACDLCTVPIEIWAKPGNAAPYFKFYDLTYFDDSVPPVDRSLCCPATVIKDPASIIISSMWSNLVYDIPGEFYTSTLNSPED